MVSLASARSSLRSSIGLDRPTADDGTPQQPHEPQPRHLDGADLNRRQPIDFLAIRSRSSPTRCTDSAYPYILCVWIEADFSEREQRRNASENQWRRGFLERQRTCADIALAEGEELYSNVLSQTFVRLRASSLLDPSQHLRPGPFARISMAGERFGRFAAHSRSWSSAGHIACPHLVNAYSTLGGTCG